MKSLPSASCIHTQTAEIYCTPPFIQTSFFSYPPFICAHMCIQGLHFTANSTCDKATCMTFEIQPAVLKTKPAMLLQNKNKARRSEINNPPSECHKFCWFKYNREGKKNTYAASIIMLYVLSAVWFRVNICCHSYTAGGYSD